jgi:hypothetical protein
MTTLENANDDGIPTRDAPQEKLEGHTEDFADGKTTQKMKDFADADGNNRNRRQTKQDEPVPENSFGPS